MPTPRLFLRNNMTISSLEVYRFPADIFSSDAELKGACQLGLEEAWSPVDCLKIMTPMSYSSRQEMSQYLQYLSKTAINGLILFASDQGIEAIKVPWLAETLTPNTIVDWNFTTTPQAGLANRTFSYPRGRVLGGSSSVSKLQCSSSSIIIASLS